MKCENLVYGATLDALTFALHHGYPLLYTTPVKPHFFETKKQKDWNFYYFCLSLSGLIPYSNLVKSVKYKNGLLSVVTPKKTHEIESQNIFVFDEDISGLPFPANQRESEDVMVMDYLFARGIIPCSDASIDFLNGKIYLYQSERADRPDLKDLCFVRILPRSGLREEQNSELYTRFQLEEFIEKAFGRKINLKSFKREVVSQRRVRREDIHNLKFMYDSEEYVLGSGNDYASKLVRILND